MQINGEMLIGAKGVRGAEGELKAFSPAAGKAIEAPVFGGGSVADVEAACVLAQQAFDSYRALPLSVRAEFLERIASGILDLGDALIERAHEESGLPKARLEGERGRTVGQLKLFAQTVRDGRWLSATLDSAQPERKPAPRSDLRMQKIALQAISRSRFPWRVATPQQRLLPAARLSRRPMARTWGRRSWSGA
jgi:alpha-ketoglutaric semialdehyde dehydrogenase